MKIAALLLLSACLGSSIGVKASEPINAIETPHGGWTYSGIIDTSNQKQVDYPMPLIDRGIMKNRTLIEGSIHATSKQRQATLSVNGNPMALNTDEHGRYARHYAFGRGSNGIEVKDADGHTLKRVQFYEANPDQITPQLRIICSWDAADAQVDMHIITPDGQHAFYADPTLKDGGGLDLDSVDGPGPSMFTTATPEHGVYHIYINYWGNFDADGYNFKKSNREIPTITTRITLIYYENTPHEKRETFIVPLRKIGDLTLVKSIVF